MEKEHFKKRNFNTKFYPASVVADKLQRGGERNLFLQYWSLHILAACALSEVPYLYAP